MMWNFLQSGLLAETAIVLFDGNPGYPDLGVLWDLAARAGITTFGTSAAYIAACMKAGIEPGRGARPLPPARRRLDRQPARAGGLRLDLRATRLRHLALLDLRRHRRLQLLRHRRADAAGLPRRAAGAGARREGGVLGRGGPAAHRRGRRAGGDRADALDAALPLGRRDRRALPRVLLRDVSRGLAPRRLDRDHRPRHRDHLRPLRLDDQPRRGPHRHRRDLPRRPRLRRDHRRPRRRPAEGGHRRRDRALRRPPRGGDPSTTTSAAPSPARSASAAAPATSPTKSAPSTPSPAPSPARWSRSRSNAS